MKGINQKLKLYCPVWYGRIRRTRDENKMSFLDWDKFGTNLRNGSMCVVGELHGWYLDYSNKVGVYCEDCQEFANALYTFAWYGHDIEAFKTQVNLLVDHIEKDHPEIVEKRCGPTNMTSYPICADCGASIFETRVYRCFLCHNEVCANCVEVAGSHDLCPTCANTDRRPF